jgi:hypothetical protein
MKARILVASESDEWRNIAISLIDQRSKRVMAFHEKAGRSQVGCSIFSLGKVFLLPSGHCRHASIRTLEERFHFARCMLGVLGTAGAAI